MTCAVIKRFYKARIQTTLSWLTHFLLKQIYQIIRLLTKFICWDNKVHTVILYLKFCMHTRGRQNLIGLDWIELDRIGSTFFDPIQSDQVFETPQSDQVNPIKFLKLLNPIRSIRSSFWNSSIRSGQSDQVFKFRQSDQVWVRG